MGTSVSSAAMARIRTFAAAAAAFLLALGLAPMAAFGFESVAGPLATDSQDESVAGGFTPLEYENDARSASPNSSNEPQRVSASQNADDSRVAPMLASGLFGSPAGIVSSDVSLDAADPIVGSFTVDGLTYAVGPDGLTLVAVSSDPQQITDSQDADDSRVAPMLASGQVAIPATVAYNGTTYSVTAIGPYSFYLSGATDVSLPASVATVDSRAFRSSDVERVEVAADNPNIASYDGALYSADLTSLLLIPEGRAGSVPIPSEAEAVEASKFSHCSLVDAISVDGDGADFASWEGLLYSADGTTLLRVPAGATEITIRDGCTTIAAGALEGCAKLERINAPASVTSISPDVLTSIPTVALPAASVSGSSQQVTGSQDADDSRVAPMLASGQADDPTGAEGEAEVSPRRVVASSQGLEAPWALPDLGSTSASPTAEAEVQMASQDEASSGVASALADQANASADFVPQLTAMVALSTVDDDLPEAGSSSIEVFLVAGMDASPWLALGFNVLEMGADNAPVAVVREGSSYAANSVWYLRPNDTSRGHIITTSVKYASGSAPMNTPRASAANSITGGTSSCSGDSKGSYSWTAGIYYEYGYVAAKPGYLFKGWSASQTGNPSPSFSQTWVSGTVNQWAIFHPIAYTIVLDANGSGVSVTPASIATTYDAEVALPTPVRPAYRFIGWNTSADGSGASYGATATKLTTTCDATVTLYAQWERDDYDLGFDVDSEPGDSDYPGNPKDDQTVNVEDGPTVIEDPKRPGYVFEGWVIPNADDTEAIDQELVYQDEADGKWYVDASKLPDYAGDDGRVELTARWTAALSVDAPISATFMYDLSQWDGEQSRDAYVEGSSTVKNRSAVPIRVSGIESAVGDAAGVLKRGDGTTLADASAAKAAKVLSVFPTASATTGTEGDAKAPASDDAADDLAHKVDMALSDVKLEAAFDAASWAVDAATVGDNGVTVSTGDLKLGYRLNLGSATGVTLDQDALLAVTGDPDAGASKDAAIANLTYCFAAEGLIPTGTKSDPLWVEVADPEVGSVGVYGIADIKRAAEDFSARVDPATDPNDQDAIYAQLASSPYFELFRQLLEHDVSFQVKVDGRYLPLQLLGICQDTKTKDGKRAGLTFQMRDIYAFNNTRSNDAGGGTFNYTYMNSTNTNSGGWESSVMRSTLHSTFWGYLPPEVQAAIVGVDKFQQLPGGTDASKLQKTTGETVWLPSMYEVFGASFSDYNESEALTTVAGYAPFQYMAYQPGGKGDANIRAIKTYNGSASRWWLRSARWNGTLSFCSVYLSGTRNFNNASFTYGAPPCLCL